MDRTSLIQALEKHKAYLTKKPQSETVKIGTESFSYSWLLLSVTEFLQKLHENPDIVALNEFIQENYLLFQAGGRKTATRRKMLVTGYYEPLFAGSLTPTADYQHPIYMRPPSLKVINSPDNPKKVGRYDKDNNFIAYWSRKELEDNNLLFGYELAFLKDPFDAFLLHVQGSGRIKLPNGKIVSVRFAGSNGLEYNSIGKLLMDENILELKDVSIPAIRAYLNSHPEEIPRILQHNPRFIFFSWPKKARSAPNTDSEIETDSRPNSGPNSGPKGSIGEVLTPGRSIAIDHSSLPGTTLAYLRTRRPVVDNKGRIQSWTELERFVVPQDSGSAIKGTGRVDLFWGNGVYAEVAANNMKEEGQLYFLIKKGYPGTNHQ